MLSEQEVVESLKFVEVLVSKHLTPSQRARFESEAYSDGFFGLAKACLKFDPSLGYQLSSLAGTCIRNELIDGIHKRRRFFRVIHLVKEFGDLEDFSDVTYDEEPEIDIHDYLQWLFKEYRRKYPGSCSRRNLKIVRDYFAGVHHKKLAEKYKQARPTVYKNINLTLTRLREIAQERECHV